MADVSEDVSPAGGADVMLRVSHYALLSGLAQFIPLPFADDLADQQVRKRMLSVLLRRRGRSFDVEEIRPLYTGLSGGLVRKAGSVTKSLLLKPVKKLFRTVFFFLTFRRALLEATGALLLGHTLDRLLAGGWLAADLPRDRRKAQAEQIVGAIDAAWASADRRGLMALVRKSARHLRGWNLNWLRPTTPTTPTPIPDAASEVDALESSMDPQARRKLDTAARQLEKELEAEQGRSLLARFDAMVDARLQAVS